MSAYLASKRGGNVLRINYLHDESCFSVVPCQQEVNSFVSTTVSTGEGQ